MLKFTGDEFRQMTIDEFVLGLDGHLESRGLKKKKGMSRNEFLDLAAKFGG